MAFYAKNFQCGKSGQSMSAVHHVSNYFSLMMLSALIKAQYTISVALPAHVEKRLSGGLVFVDIKPNVDIKLLRIVESKMI